MELGYLDLPKSILFAGALEGRINSPVVGFLVKRRGLTILFDTGYDSRKKYENPPVARLTQRESNYLPNQLKALGVDVRSIDAAVVSHLHFDHAGFPHIFRNTGVPVVVQKSELRNAYYPSMGENKRKVFRREDFDFQNLNYFELNGDYQIDLGLEIIQLPRHTPRIQGLFAETEIGQRYLFLSDAVNALENFGPPRRFQGQDWSTEAWISSVKS